MRTEAAKERTPPLAAARVSAHPGLPARTRHRPNLRAARPPHPAGPSRSRKLATGLSTIPIESNIRVTSHLTPKSRWTVVYDYRNRWYLSEAVVFGERDPLGPVDSANLYQYVRYNPLNTHDPLGLLDDWDVGPFGKGNPEYQRAIERYRNRRRVFFLPRFDFVEAWYFTSDGVLGSTVTTGLVDLKGRSLPLDDQAYLLKKHPYLPRYDNPGLAQLFRSPRLLKLTYAEQGKILLDWINLNLTIVQVSGIGVAFRGAILGLEGLASTAYQVATKAGILLTASKIGSRLSERDYNGAALSLTFFVIPKVVNDQFIGGIEVLTDRGMIILKSLNDFHFVIGEYAVHKGRGTRNDRQ